MSRATFFALTSQGMEFPNEDGDACLCPTSGENLSFEDIMQLVHGKRNMHFGATVTWRKAKELFPSAKILIESVRRYVRECKICQKMRNTGVKGLPEQYLTLKPSAYRAVVGVDHVTITPADKHGNCCAILVVEHHSHFPKPTLQKTTAPMRPPERCSNTS